MAGVSTTNTLIRSFDHSPYELLQNHMRIVIECVSQVPALFLALRAADENKLEEVRDIIFKLENAANEIKNRFRSDLPHHLFMPIDRNDLLEILTIQDGIADTAREIANMLILRDLRLPGSLHVGLMNLVQCSVDACTQMGKLIAELDKLLESGISGPETEKIAGMIDEISAIKTDTDTKAFALLRNLFAREEEIGPLDVMIWLRVIHWIGDLADHAEHVGNRNRLLIAQ